MLLSIWWLVRTYHSLVTLDDQVKAYIKKIMSQLNKWMVGGKISKLVVVITSKETGEHVERWQFDVNGLISHPVTMRSNRLSKVQIFNKAGKRSSAQKSADKENAAPAYVYT